MTMGPCSHRPKQPVRTTRTSLSIFAFFSAFSRASAIFGLSEEVQPVPVHTIMLHRM